MESSSTPTMAKRLWHIVQVVFYMLRKTISKRKLMMDLHLLLKRGKIAGKAIGNLVAFHHQHHHGASAASFAADGHFSAFSSCSIDTAAPFFSPAETEFSCSNTPFYANYFRGTAKRKNRRRRHDDCYDAFDAAAIAVAFEMLNAQSASGEESSVSSLVPTPSPALMLDLGRSPVARPLRVTDSPFPVKEDEAADGGRVDEEAEAFIRRFYEQLWRQQLSSAAATPDHCPHRRQQIAGRG
ncbi:hypothetical protein AXF42_Ash005282 [Apostasia shenzhenica]|uniref:Avr9/Cf-9 rapidly elicited protein n=1 Tax=Apostasia shenzhenica TaxID=1088818 RepID=A0A2I0B6G1_9ASPA|nr:hypothetical protein AXF42_Ash005282 [Apostasia shenzhenica]